ncbi:N-acetylglucosamine-specific PTS transporter subunit IIBC [Paenibacillus sp. 2TAB23]|uniref:N-acetylglucosamine-specific PTS transporter subunit IIBC n=1 Tax=Paenibacillus sp. 2TAB23 TaxID=3233004 RepID=UPI003F9D6911
MLAFLQKIGKALMLPIASLPAASLLLRFGNIDYVKDLGLGANVGGWLNQYLAPFLNAGGSAIFGNLPLIFAIGVAIGLSGDAVAALAAVIAYKVLVNVLDAVPLAFDFIGQDTKINMGVIGGIVAGLVSSGLYKRYHNIKLPDWLGFFSGKRFVPIVTSFAMVAVGLLFGLIWAPVQSGLDIFGRWVVDLGGIGAFIFMTANRLLVPFGLHHILNSIAWFQIGSFTDAAGNVVHGDLTRFFAGDKTAGMFMTGFFPIMMFALPGAALAIIHTAKKERRKAVASIFIGAAAVSFLTGITEPIEFAFMFAAPLLFVMHALLAGVSGFIMATLGVKLGAGFSQGLIDYLINFSLGTKPLLMIPVGLCFGLIYYVLFRFAIVTFNLKTPGRETGEEKVGKDAAGTSSLASQAVDVLHSIGGAGNISDIDACITRLRLVVKDEHAVDDKKLKELGASGIMRLGKGVVQVIFGVKSEMLKDEIKKIM